MKARLGMAVGIVTNTEIEDATPAAMVAHTRRRTTYDRDRRAIFRGQARGHHGRRLGQFPARRAATAAKRADEVDYIAKFREAGYAFASNAGEMTGLAGSATTTRLLGLFNTGNMDGALDRKFLKGGSVKKFPDQPDLTEQVGGGARRCCRAIRTDSS